MDERIQPTDDISPIRNYTTWQLIKAYWQSDKRFSVILISFVILIMTIVLVFVDVAVSYWFNYFYDALQAYNKFAVMRLFIIFFLLAAFNIVIAVYRYYISQLFVLRWREWLTEKIITRWLQQRAYYYLETFDKQTDNPDQRIQEDVFALTSMTLSLIIGLISAITTFFAFIFILWNLSGVLIVSLGPLGHVSIPGYLAWVSIVYAIVGTYCAFKLGRPLIDLNFEQQRREASFRFAAMDLRTHAEHVALYQGETPQKHILLRLFDRVLDNYYLLILRQKILLWFTAGYNQASVVLPLLVVLPNYFNKVFLLGGFMQSIKSFSIVQDALSFIVNSYSQIAEWQAVNNRLTSFLNHATTLNATINAQEKIQLHTHASNAILLKDVTLKTPDAEILLANVNLTFSHGQHYLLTGRSGLGKSTLIKTIAGIWPYAQGEIVLPAQMRTMFLSQRPYMPLGTLAGAITFPQPANLFSKKPLAQVLIDCQLEKFIPRLNETAMWSEQLSPGEQQRIAIARIVLMEPDWVFLDESTSMVDIATEQALYQLLKKQLPHCSIISVGHRPSLETHHDQVIDLAQFH